jgi:hypothetical protein
MDPGAITRVLMSMNDKHHYGKDDHEMGDMKMNKDKRLQMLHMINMQCSTEAVWLTG